MDGILRNTSFSGGKFMNLEELKTQQRSSYNTLSVRRRYR